MLVKQRIKRKTVDNTRVQFEQRSFLFFIYLHSGVDCVFFVCVEGELFESGRGSLYAKWEKKKRRRRRQVFFLFFSLLLLNFFF